MGWRENWQRSLDEGHAKQVAKAQAEGKKPPGGPPTVRLMIVSFSVLGVLLIGGCSVVVNAFSGGDEPDDDTTKQAQEPISPAARDDDSERGGQAARQQSERERAEAERRRRAERGETGRVTRVIDGDTVEIEGVGRVRLIGVDTPERGEECFDEATGYLKDRVSGQTVRYRYQSEREDRYDRQLLDLFRGGELVNLDIAQAGWGEELTIAPNDRYQTRIAAAEQEARTVPRGRWAGCFEEPEPEPGPDRDNPPPSGEDDDDDGGDGSAVPDGNCSEVGITDFPVPPGDRRDRDGDGIACES